MENIFFYDLYHAAEQDKIDFTPHKNCFLYRLYSENTGSFPIVSINPEKSLIYFLENYETEKSGWDKRGIKLDFRFPSSIQ